MLTPDDDAYMRDFYRALAEEPLDPSSDPRYVALYEQAGLGMPDPVEDLGRVIGWNVLESAQLFSGFRGTGKSTELRRLRDVLHKRGYIVALVDISAYLNTSVPIDVSDFLMFLAGAFGDALVRDGAVTRAELGEGFWSRLVSFGRRIGVEELSASAKVEAEPEAYGVKLGEVGAELKINLKNDTTFRSRLQERMKGHLGALVAEVHAYVRECVEAIRRRHGDASEVALLVDSVERIRGTFVSADEVQSSLESLFVAQSEHLRLPGVHVVYTAPPWLKVRYAQVGSLYDGFQMLAAIKVSEKGTGAPFAQGIEAFEAVLAARGDWRRLLGSRERMVRLVQASGGHLRDVVRLLREVLVGARSLPTDDARFDHAFAKLKNEMLPISDEHARWMAHILRTQRASLSEASKLPDLARFLDTHQVLGYRNGDEWYDVHPLIADEVLRQVADLATRTP